MTDKQINESILDSSLTLRPAKWADLNGVAQLTYDVCAADGDATVASSPQDLKRFWKDPQFNLETDAWIAQSADGRIVGYEEFYNLHAHAALTGDGYVHPNFKGRGIGTALLRALDRRVLDEMRLADPRARVYMRNGMAISDTTAREMHENEGYHPVRFSWRMEITLNGASPAPKFPVGVELRPFDIEAHNRKLYEAHEEAFSDHWGHVPGTFERWNHNMIEREDFNPSLYFVAWDGDEIAGYSLCRVRSGIGWVGTLGVRRAWRKRGLGEALLLHSFAAFHQRDMKTVGLGVDAQNPTGATRLYQKVGMKVASEYVIYEKEYRSGIEPDQLEGKS
jgi:mycothiol synthase